MGALRYIVDRVDGWLNTAMGFGGVSDKLKGTRYSGTVRSLTSPEVTAMYRSEHLSAKIVDVYPREAYREGFELSGGELDKDENDTPPKDDATTNVDAEDGENDGAAPGASAKPGGGEDVEEQIRTVLRDWKVVQIARTAAIWGRLYGGAKVWMGSLTADPAAPFVMGEQIDFLRVIDKRYLTPRSWSLDEQGNPTQYDVTLPEGGATVGPIHASRLVHFGGALTDDQTKIVNGYWDDSVLQRPYEALQSDGIVWRSAQQLISEASVGVLSIKGLYAKLTGPARKAIEDRLAFFNLSRSVARNMTLDLEGEKYERVQTTFAGVSDLTMEGIKRVASAAEIPVAILLSDEPSGLNATGDSSIRWWLMRVHAYRTGELENPTLYLCRCVVAQAGIKVKVEKLALKWGELWTASAKEQSEIYSATATADCNYFDRGILTGPSIALSRFGKDGYSQETTIDRSLYEEPEELTMPTDGEPGAEGVEGEDPTKAPAAKPGKGPQGENVQQQVLNGTQVSSLVDIVAQVADEKIPRDAGVEIVMLAYQVDQPKAEKLLGSAGNGFKVKQDPVAAPFGGGPPKPGEKPEDAPPAPKPTKTPVKE